MYARAREQADLIYRLIEDRQGAFLLNISAEGMRDTLRNALPKFIEVIRREIPITDQSFAAEVIILLNNATTYTNVVEGGMNVIEIMNGLKQSLPQSPVLDDSCILMAKMLKNATFSPGVTGGGKVKASISGPVKGYVLDDQSFIHTTTDKNPSVIFQCEFVGYSSITTKVGQSGHAVVKHNDHDTRTDYVDIGSAQQAELPTVGSAALVEVAAAQVAAFTLEEPVAPPAAAAGPPTYDEVLSLIVREAEAAGDNALPTYLEAGGVFDSQATT